VKTVYQEELGEKAVKQLFSAALALLAVSVLAIFSIDSLAQERCQGGKTHVIHVSPDGAGNAQVTQRGEPANAVHVCNGDQIQWVLKGSDREFLIKFLSTAPFANGESRGSSSGVVLVTVNAAPGDYDYGVNFVGDEPVDPRIIVDP
jgi:hypothetical protein